MAAGGINVLVCSTFWFGLTVYFNPIRQTFGWTAAITSVVASIGRFGTNIFGPIVGFTADKIGPRKVMVLGCAVIGLGFVLASRIQSLSAFYLTFVMVAAGVGLASMLVMDVAIAHWFSKKRSRALSIIYIGNGVGGLLVVLLALLVDSFGWRVTLTLVGTAFWVIGIPLSLLIRHKPDPYGYLCDGETVAEDRKLVMGQGSHSATEKKGHSSVSLAADFTVREAMKTRAFWLLTAVALFQQVGTASVMLHIVPYLVSIKFSPNIAAAVVSGMSLFGLTSGRMGIGFLGDFINKRYLITVSMACLVVGLVLLSFVEVNKVWIIILFILTYATGDGGIAPLRPGVQADLFGAKNFGAIMGVIGLLGMLGGLIGPIVAGWAFDVMGSYRVVWRIFALIMLPAVPLMLFAKPPKLERKS